MYIVDNFTADLIRDKQAAYKSSGIDINVGDAIEEVVADACGMVLRDNKMLFELQKSDKALWTQVKAWLGKHLGRVKTAFDGVKAELTETQEMEAVFDDLQKLWTEGAVAASKVQVGTQTETTTSEYSIKASAISEIDKALSDKNVGGDIQLTDTTPDIMLYQKGVKNYPLVMDASHIRENILTEEEAKKLGLKVDEGINYHGLGVALFTNVINDLGSVTLAYRGTKNAFDPDRRTNYFLLISQHKDSGGNVINIPVYINQTKNVNRVMINANVLATVFGKENFNEYIRRELNNGNIVRIKKRGPKGSESPAPIAVDYADVTSSDEAADQTAMTSYEPSVPQSKRSVKSIDSEGNTLTQEQAEYFKNSKIRTADGKLLVVHNGTRTNDQYGQPIELGYVYKPLKESLLNKKEPNKIGFFFTDNIETARDYSKTWDTNTQSMVDGRINSVYLNIENPIDLSDLGTRSTEKQFYNLLKENGVATHRKRFNSDTYLPIWRWFDYNQIELNKEIKNAGFDGIVFHDYGEINNTYIAFNSNQIKLTSNISPSGNPDIRYSVKSDAAEKAESELARIEYEYQSIENRKKELASDPEYSAALDARRSAKTMAERREANRAVRQIASVLGLNDLDDQSADAYGKVVEARRALSQAAENMTVSEINDAIIRLRTERDELKARSKEIENSEEYRKLFDSVVNNLDDQSIAAYNEYAEKSGYDEISRRIQLIGEIENIYNEQSEKAYRKKENEERQRRLEKSGKNEAEFDRAEAVKEFGYTPYFYDAGYILPNGKMLNFSGEKGKHFGTRGQDHRAIGTIFESGITGSEAMVRFMNEGNIRIMAESPGIDIGTTVEPTASQYSQIRKFAEDSRKKEYFNMDFTDAGGNVVGNIEYENVKPDKIVNDIKHFFSTGTVLQQSVVSRFHYSIKNTSRMTLKEQLHDYYSNDLKVSDAFYFGEPDLSDIGFKKLPLAMTQTDFEKSATGKHNSPRRAFKSLVKKLTQDKILSFEDNGRVGVLVDDIDGDGKPLLIALAEGVMDRKPVNLMNSVYGVESNWLDIMVKSGRKLKIYDINKATKFFQTNGYKAEVGKAGDYVLIKAQGEPSVNTEDAKFSLKQTNAYDQFQAEQEARAQERSNERLARQNEILRGRWEYWKGQTKRSKQTLRSRRELRSFTNKLLRDYDSTLNRENVEMHFLSFRLYKPEIKLLRTRIF